MYFSGGILQARRGLNVLLRHTTEEQMVRSQFNPYKSIQPDIQTIYSCF